MPIGIRKLVVEGIGEHVASGLGCKLPCVGYGYTADTFLDRFMKEFSLVLAR